MRNKTSYFIFVILALNVILSCSKTMTNDGYPAYIHMDSATMISTNMPMPTYSIYGADVNVEGDVRGMLQFPFSVPVLKSGIHSAYISPCVKRNNLSSSIIIYPMYKPIYLDLNLTPKATFDTNLTFTYFDNIAKLCSESFEINLNFSGAVSSSTARTGQSSMSMSAALNTADSIATALYYKTITFNALKTTYLEFDYYMPSGAFTPALSFQDANAATYKIFGDNWLKPNSGWTHVYFHLSPLIGTSPVTDMTLTFYLTPESGHSNAQVFIDNLLLIEK